MAVAFSALCLCYMPALPKPTTECVVTALCGMASVCLKTGLGAAEAAERKTRWVGAGHVHAYERNYQTYNYQVNGCAPRWLTMGGGPPSLDPHTYAF